MLGHGSAAMTLDVYAGLFGDDLDSVAHRLDALVPQAATRPIPRVIDLDTVRSNKPPVIRPDDSVGPVGLEPSTYG